MRYFPFNTQRAIRSTFRGSARDPGRTSERDRFAYSGLSGDSTGSSQVDPSGFSGYMADWKIRELAKGGAQKRDIWFSIELAPLQLPGSSEPTPQIREVSAANFIRHIDGLAVDQCPVCRKRVRATREVMSTVRRCSCGFYEVLPFGTPAEE